MSDGWVWDRVARLPGLSPVIDYQRRESHWARYLDAQHKRALERQLAASPGDRFIDYGCGIGRIAAWLAPRVAEVIAVDPSPEMIAEARRRHRLSNVSFHCLPGDRPPAGLAQLQKVVGGAEQGPAPKGPFDGLTAIWVLQHVIEERALADTVDLFAAVLRPGAGVYTIDRLQRAADDGGDRLGYQRVRQIDDYEATFCQRGFLTVARTPILIDEKVLGRSWLTALVKRTGWWTERLGERDLRWAAGRRAPERADYLWHFQRR